MKVPEASISLVVAEASAKMQDMDYITGRVDRLTKAQPSITQYVIAHQTELSFAGIVSVLFNAALIHESVYRATGRFPSRVSYADLDAAALATPTLEALANIEPNLASFIVSNLDSEQGSHFPGIAGKILAHVAMALATA